MKKIKSVQRSLLVWTWIWLGLAVAAVAYPTSIGEEVDHVAVFALIVCSTVNTAALRVVSAVAATHQPVTIEGVTLNRAVGGNS